MFRTGSRRGLVRLVVDQPRDADLDLEDRAQIAIKADIGSRSDSPADPTRFRSILCHHAVG